MQDDPKRADDEVSATAQQAAAEATWMARWLHGPSHTRWSTLPPQAGDRAPDVALPDTSGRARALSGWWSSGPLHLVFLRHFGCSCLADRWAELEPMLGRLADAGATTVAVCQAEPERARLVVERRGYGFDVLCDSERRAYAAYGLLEGTPAAVLHDFAWRAGDHATAEQWVASRRGTERALVDDPWQLPGEFVIARGGRMVLAHRAQHCEDFPPAGVLIGAIAEATASSSAPDADAR